MAIMHITKYKCDICGKVYDKEYYLKKIILPYKDMTCVDNDKCTKYKEFDSCEDCKERYENIVFTKFAILTEYNNSLL